jgi:sugar fermentation stimulation protein A
MEEFMIYSKIKQGIFLARPNRFLAQVRIEEQIELCHVKNTGRCKELLVLGATVYVEDHGETDKRKTRYSVICVRKGNVWINIDSQAPNRVVAEWIENKGLFRKLTYLKPEVKYGNSRFDLYAEADGKKIFIEVKGVTLEENGVARFPDAPTERGIKHIKELMKCIEDGYEAYLIFVIQMKGVHLFEPNDKTHMAFGDALREAKQCGVRVMAIDCNVTPDTILIDQCIELKL